MSNSTKLKNRYYGVTGVEVVNGMLNTDFDHLPPTTYNDIPRASNFSYKYPMKKYYKMLGNPVLGLKQPKNLKNKLVCKTIDETFTDDTGIELKKETDSRKVLKKLFEYKDVKQTGIVFAVGNNNIGINGAAQISDGINLDKDTNLKEDVNGTPFRNSNESKSDSQNTTLGTRNILDHAIFGFPFSVVPETYKVYEKILEGFEGYTEEDFELFKKATLHGVSHVNSVAKSGCTNAFAIFIKCKENTMPIMANLHLYISYERIGLMYNRIIGNLNITELIQYLSPKVNKIEDIEIYIQPFILSVVANINGEKVTINNNNSEKLFDGKVPVRFYEIEEEGLL